MKVLSKNNAKLKIVFPLFLTLFGSVILFAILADHSILKYLISLTVLILGVTWTYKSYIRSYNLFYNDENLILKNKKAERNISLINIKRVKLTLSDMRLMGFQFYEYKIDFTNEVNSLETISYFVSNLDSLLWEFQELVKIKSPATIIENHASSWDK